MHVLEFWSDLFIHEALIENLLSKILSLLIGHLSNWRVKMVLNHGAVTYRIDVRVIEHLKVVVGKNTIGFLMRKFQLFNKIE